MKDEKAVLEMRWKVVEDCSVEDMSIFTVTGVEVVGCSEWMRAERFTFDYIVSLHNKRLDEVKP